MQGMWVCSISFLRRNRRRRLLWSRGSRASSGVTMILMMVASSIPSHSSDGRRCAWTSCLQNYITRLCWRWRSCGGCRGTSKQRAQNRDIFALWRYIKISSAGFVASLMRKYPDECIIQLWHFVPYCDRGFCGAYEVQLTLIRVPDKPPHQPNQVYTTISPNWPLRTFHVRHKGEGIGLKMSCVDCSVVRNWHQSLLDTGLVQNGYNQTHGTRNTTAGHWTVTDTSKSIATAR